MAIRFPRFTAARRQKALKQAEREFAKNNLKRGKAKHVSIRTSEIKERLELFQPREFSYGTSSVDGEWVKELARRMGIHGELDPVLVIRIGNEWVCVPWSDSMPLHPSILLTVSCRDHSALTICF